jgi:hypothetical protein
MKRCASRVGVRPLNYWTAARTEQSGDDLTHALGASKLEVGKLLN